MSKMGEIYFEAQEIIQQYYYGTDKKVSEVKDIVANRYAGRPEYIHLINGVIDEEAAKHGNGQPNFSECKFF